MGGCFGKSSDDSERERLMPNSNNEWRGDSPDTRPRYDNKMTNGTPKVETDAIDALQNERRNGRRNGFERSLTDPDREHTENLSRAALEGAKPRSPSLNERLFHHSATAASVTTEKGRGLKEKLIQAQRWKDRYYQPTQEFLSLMDNLFMECQVHLTLLSTKKTSDSMAEADALVEEMIALRNHWGTELLPVTTCNAFVRERISLTIVIHQYRIDCAQFFEPVPFHAGSTETMGQAMKLFRFSVYDLTKNEIVMRYYLERKNATKLFYALCYISGNTKAQVHSYGHICPRYWDVREHMLTDVCSRLEQKDRVH